MRIQLKGQRVVSVHHQLAPSLAAVLVVADQAGVRSLVVAVVWETKNKLFLLSLSLRSNIHDIVNSAHLLSVVSLQIQGLNIVVSRT